MLVLFVLLVTLPLSLIFWLSSVILFGNSGDAGTIVPPTPWRWLISLLLPIIIVRSALRKKSLSTSGAAAALLVGFLLTISNYCFFASLLAFFLTSSKATKYKDHLKRRFEEDFKEGGQRNWVQVLCNGGIAAELALFFVMEGGCWEPPIDFSRHYNVSWLCMCVVGALSCCTGDTYASELGSVLSRGDPFLLTTFQRVPRGTNGGVSPAGLIVSGLGGLVIGVTYYLALLLFCPAEQLSDSPAQWPVIVVAGLSGLIGSLIDSLLGATLQFSGYDTVKQVIVEKPGDKVQPISGVPLLCNHSVNLLSAFLTSLITPRLAYNIWGYCR